MCGSRRERSAASVASKNCIRRKKRAAANNLEPIYFQPRIIPAELTERHICRGWSARSRCALHLIVSLKKSLAEYFHLTARRWSPIDPTTKKASLWLRWCTFDASFGAGDANDLPRSESTPARCVTCLYSPSSPTACTTANCLLIVSTAKKNVQTRKLQCLCNQVHLI